VRPVPACADPVAASPRRAARAAKCCFDCAVALVALVALLPALVAVAVGVRCSSYGPIFFRQVRVGRDGREFTMWKFRTMRHDAFPPEGNDADGPLFKLRDDPRVTALGRLLRRWSLDELPQLVNVLCGSMSLVGPRPPLPTEVAEYGDDARRRLLVKPGMSGLWQVSGRSDLPWADAVGLDVHYVDQWSLGLDAAILLRTPAAVLGRRGAY
jgi:lipopolysaccharide/colanic/teichoic acid biosynthesis glycosyltransferase